MTLKLKSHTKPISIDNIDINKIVVSNEASFRRKVIKSFISYKEAKKIKPLCIFLSKMSSYRRDESKCMAFLIKDENFLEKYQENWEKVSIISKRKFNREPVHNKKYLKTNIKSYKEKKIQKKTLSVFIYQ